MKIAGWRSPKHGSPPAHGAGPSSQDHIPQNPPDPQRCSSRSTRGHSTGGVRGTHHGLCFCRSGDTALVGSGTHYGLCFCRFGDTAPVGSGTHHGLCFCRSGDTAPAGSGTHHGPRFCRFGDTALAVSGTHHGSRFCRFGDTALVGAGTHHGPRFCRSGDTAVPVLGRMIEGSVQSAQLLQRFSSVCVVCGMARFGEESVGESLHGECGELAEFRRYRWNHLRGEMRTRTGLPRLWASGCVSAGILGKFASEQR